MVNLTDVVFGWNLTFSIDLSDKSKVNTKGKTNTINLFFLQ